MGYRRLAYLRKRKEQSQGPGHVEDMVNLVLDLLLARFAGHVAVVHTAWHLGAIHPVGVTESTADEVRLGVKLGGIVTLVPALFGGRNDGHNSKLTFIQRA